MDLAAIGQALSVWLVPVVLAITLHEAAHGWMANRLGDDTALRMGRITANPIKHVDPVGTLAVPGMLLLLGSPFLFGWAKPVPVAFHRLHHPKRDMIWVALAGPVTNLLLAFVSALAFRLLPVLPTALAAWLGSMLAASIAINIVLAVFNMIPIPPLDGGRVLTGLLPYPYAVRFARLERYGLFILIGTIFLLPLVLAQVGIGFDPLRWIIGPPFELLRAFYVGIAGLN
jgi:Zn-dependent protease